MSQQILQLNFKFDVPRNDYETMCSSLAADFAKVPGCQWKIWLMNEKENEAGGIYLFEDEKALEQFKASPLAAGVLSHPALSGFSVKQFDILEKVSNITRAPLAMAGEAV
ncbi:MAG TPA: YdhR family protein [Chitinophagaceae bacterium]|nr:YdhR family protein [Chitinophagaceae bacterium]